MKQSNLDFVLRHYRRGALSAKKAWQQLDIPESKPHLLDIFAGRRAAAAACVAAVLTASAIMGYHLAENHDSSPAVQQSSAAVVPPPVQSETAAPRLEFKNAPLSEVVKTIESTYGVHVDGLGDDGNLRLTLSYQGSERQLVNTINELLGTELSLRQQ